MKRCRKIIAIMLCLGIVLGCSICTTASTYNADIEEATQVLLQSGWTQEEIDDMLTEEIILEYKDVQPAVVSERKFFKVTEEGTYEITQDVCEREVALVKELKEAEQTGGVMHRTVIPGGTTGTDTVVTTDGYLEYYVSAYNAGGGEYILSARYEWLISPWNRKIDVFGLGHDSNLTQLDDYGYSYVYKYDYKVVNGNNINELTAEVNTPTGISIDDGGTVVKQELKNDIVVVDGPSETYYNHRGFLQYRARVNNSNVNTVAVYAEYLHQEGAVQVSPSISYPASGSISVTYSTFFNRMSPNPYLSIDL